MSDREQMIKDFFQNISQESLFEPNKPGDDKVVYWDKITFYLKQLYEIYHNVSAQDDLLIQELVERYYQCDDVMAVRLEWSHIYQNLDAIKAVFNSANSNLEELQDILDDTEFKQFIFSVVAKAQKTIDECNIQLRKKRDAISEEIEKISRIRSSAYDFLLDQVAQTKADAENAKVQAEEAKKQAELAKSLTNTVNEQIKTVSEQIEAVNGQIKTVDRQAEEVKKRADNILSSVLTVLGIFVAILVALFGGYFTVRESIVAIDEISITPQIQMAHFLLMGQVLIALVFLLVFMIARLSDKNIYVFCKNFIVKNLENQGEINEAYLCSSCANKCPYYKRFFQKYPYIVGINLVIIIGYVTLFLWWYIDVFLYSTIKEHLSTFRIALTVFIIFIVFCILITFVLRMLWKKVDSKHE